MIILRLHTPLPTINIPYIGFRKHRIQIIVGTTVSNIIRHPQLIKSRILRVSICPPITINSFARPRPINHSCSHHCVLMDLSFLSLARRLRSFDP